MARVGAAPGAVRPVKIGDMAVWLWRLLSSGQLAVAVITLLAIAGLLAVAIPQLPPPMRGNALAINAWLAAREGTFGQFTQPMYRLGLFDVVRAWWFVTGLGLLGVSTLVFMVDRAVFAWRVLARPQTRLPDSFFDRAANRAVIALPRTTDGPATLAGILERRRFRVKVETAGDATYLFGDRFAWAQLGTFLSHGAVLLLLVGGLLSFTRGFTQDLFIAEGRTSPVFPVSHQDQMLVEVVDAYARFDAQGAARDYRSELIIYEDGREAKRGVTTVNDPFTYGGYTFHQAAYFGEGAQVQVRDIATGNMRYDEVLALEDFIPAPAVQVVGDQALLLADVIVPTDFIGDARGSLLTLPDGKGSYWVGVVPDQRGETFSMVVYDRRRADVQLIVPEGQSRSSAGLTWRFVATEALPATVISTLPGDNASTAITLSETQGEPYLTLLGAVDGRALTLYPNQPVRVGDNEYEFVGRREFAGISVTRDPGVNIVWVGAGMLLAGLLITFYVPRLRVWARIRDGEATIAAQAERKGPFLSEMKQIEKDLAVQAARQGGEAHA